jgi:acyl carrier protein
MGMDTVEIVLWAEQAFNLHLPDDEVSEIFTVGQFSAYLSQKICTTHGVNATITAQAVFERVKQMLIKDYGVQPALITLEAHFIRDLRLN